MSLLLPAINAALHHAEIARAKADVKSLTSAWNAYYNEYGHWPVNGQLFLSGTSYSRDASEASCLGLETVPTVIQLLAPDVKLSRADDATLFRNYNPKSEVFLTYSQDSIDPTSRAMVDPWGNPYRFLFDLNRDGRTLRSGFAPVYNSVIVWSAGPDGSDDNKADNINGWE